MLVSLTSPRLLTHLILCYGKCPPLASAENVNMYSKATARVTNKKLSNTYCKGVRQGCNLSPLLLSLYVT